MRLADGTALFFFICKSASNTYAAPVFVVDINGPKAPNVYGKDVFTFRQDSLGAWNGAYWNAYEDEVTRACNKTGDGTFCMRKIIEDGWEIKDDYPW